MRKIAGFIIFVAIIIVAYITLSDEEKRRKIFQTIEQSTGFDVENDLEELMKEAGETAGLAAGELFNELKEHLDDLELRKALNRWGKEAVEKLNKVELRQLLNDLKEEIKRGTVRYDKIFEEYLST